MNLPPTTPFFAPLRSRLHAICDPVAEETLLYLISDRPGAMKEGIGPPPRSSASRVENATQFCAANATPRWPYPARAETLCSLTAERDKNSRFSTRLAGGRGGRPILHTVAPGHPLTPCIASSSCVNRKLIAERTGGVRVDP